MSQVVQTAFANLSKFLEYRKIQPKSPIDPEKLLKEMTAQELHYVRIEGTENDKSIHVIIISKNSPAINETPKLQKIIVGSGKSNICVFHEVPFVVRSIANYKDNAKYKGQSISFHPISVLAVVHPELFHAPEYSLADEKQVLSELRIRKDQLKYFIYTDDPVMVWYNWPVGSLIRIVSQAHITGMRVKYRYLIER